MPKDDPEVTELKKEINDLIAKFQVKICTIPSIPMSIKFYACVRIKNIQEDQKKQADCTLAEKCGDLGDAPKAKLSTKRMLKGHINKVNSVHYADDSRHCVTGSLDGKLIIWDTWTGNKVQVRSSQMIAMAKLSDD